MGKTLNKATLSQMKIDVCPIQKQREVVELAKWICCLRLQSRQIKSFDSETVGKDTANVWQPHATIFWKLINNGGLKMAYFQIEKNPKKRYFD